MNAASNILVLFNQSLSKHQLLHVYVLLHSVIIIMCIYHLQPTHQYSFISPYKNQEASSILLAILQQSYIHNYNHHPTNYTPQLHSRLASIERIIRSMSSKELSNASFTFGTRAQKNLLRSNSTQETQIPHFSPPRLSCPTLSRSHGSSPLSSPLHHHCHAKSDHELSDPQTTYYCAYSLVRKDAQILSIAFSNGLVYTGYDSNLIRVWKLPEFTECAQLRTKACRVQALEVSNHIIYAACGDGKIRMWRRTWDRLVLKHVRLGSIPKSVGYIRNYIAGRDKTMKHKGPITSIAINTVEDILYLASNDKTLKVWRISDQRCIETFTAHHEPINAIMVGNDGVLYTASDDATVKVWRRNFCSHGRPHSLIFTLHAKYSPVKALNLAPNGAVLYGGCSDGYIHYWLKDWLTGQLQYGGSMQGHTHAVMCLASVGDYVVSGSADSTSRVWAREQDGQHNCLTVLVGHRGPIRCITAFRAEDSTTEDNCTICTGSLDGVLKVWRVTLTQKKIEKLCLSQNVSQHQETLAICHC